MASILRRGNPCRNNPPSPTTFAKVAAAALAAVFAIALTSFATLAASQFEGVWKVQDTSGKPFQITLSADGSAKADRAGEGLTGTWKEEGGATASEEHEVDR